MACATIMTYVPPYIYICTAPARICTPLIVSRSPIRNVSRGWSLAGKPMPETYAARTDTQLMGDYLQLELNHPLLFLQLA